MRLHISKRAQQEADEIWLHIANTSGSPDSATHLISAISECFALLAKYPYIGKSLNDRERPNVRTFPVKDYLIFYSVQSGTVRILRIIHSSRDAFAVFAGE